MAGGHVLEHLIRIPSSLDYKVAVVLEPPDKGFGFLADIFADTFDNGLVVGGGDDFQSFYGHEGYPCVGVFFHNVGVLTSLNQRFEAPKIGKNVEIDSLCIVESEISELVEAEKSASKTGTGSARKVKTHISTFSHPYLN